jgi:hypothetical protein
MTNLTTHPGSTTSPAITHESNYPGERQMTTITTVTPGTRGIGAGA